MTDALTFQVVFAVFSVVVVIVVLLSARYRRKLERERTSGLKSTATLLGWQFSDEAPLNYLPNLDNFALFRQGHSKQIKNLMYGETNGVKAALFDYIYVTGSGKSRQTHYQSVVYFEPCQLNLPFFSLRPENAPDCLVNAGPPGFERQSCFILAQSAFQSAFIFQRQPVHVVSRRRPRMLLRYPVQ